VVNQYGTLHLVDELYDHNNNDGLDTLNHEIQWHVTFNNYGTVKHDSLGALMLGADKCQYNNYGLHDFTNDGDITGIGHGGEKTNNYGTIRKSGGTGESRINSEFSNADGIVEVQTGRITIGNPVDYDWHTNTLYAGTWRVEGSGMLVFFDGSLQTNKAHVVLNGSNAKICTTPGYTWNPTYIEQSLTANQGTLEVYGDRTFSNHLDNTGTLIIGAGTELTFTGGLTNSGILSPGNSPGYVTINGDFTQDASGELQIELGGLDPGTGYDVLNIEGTASLAGILDVSLLSSLDPADIPDNYIFNILFADTITGDFDTVNLPSISEGNFEYFIDLNEGSDDIVNLRFHAVPIPGAVWLLGSGLFGLVAVRRRRNNIS